MGQTGSRPGRAYWSVVPGSVSVLVHVSIGRSSAPPGNSGRACNSGQGASALGETGSRPGRGDWSVTGSVSVSVSVLVLVLVLVHVTVAV